MGFPVSQTLAVRKEPCCSGALCSRKLAKARLWAHEQQQNHEDPAGGPRQKRARWSPEAWVNRHKGRKKHLKAISDQRIKGR